MAQGISPVAKLAGGLSEHEQKCLDKNLKAIQSALKPHKQRERNYTRRERAYKGDIDFDKDTWRHQVHPPYIMPTIETMESMLVDDSTITKVYPTQPGQEDGAISLEKILHVQMEKANIDEEWGRFVKNALICGLGIGKVDWYQKFSSAEYVDEHGEKSVETTVAFDQPRFTSIDPRNFFWDTSALNLETADYVCHRYYASRNQVKAMAEPLMEDGKVVREPRWTPERVKELLESRGVADDSYEVPGRAVTKVQTNIDHSHEYEIIEVWYRDRLVTIGNQEVLLQDEPNYFDHADLPFVVGRTIEDPNRFEQPSEVDAQIELQNALWDMLNQTLDNASLVNNAIVKISSDVEDPDAYQFYPGAVWMVDRLDEVDVFQPESRILNAVQGIVENLKGDLQTSSAALPYLSGAGDEQVDQKTATGISIISNMAQRRVLRKKSLLGYSRKRMGKLWIALNQQFLSEPLAVRTVGPDGVKFHTVDPQTIQGQYDYFIESQTESFDRQQRRTEGLNLLQTFAALAPAIPVMAQAGLNVQAFIEKALSSYDIVNPENFFAQPAAGQVAPGQPQMSALPMGAETADPNAPASYQAPGVAAQNPLTPAA